MKKRIVFIINPISGTRHSDDIEAIVRKELSADVFDIAFRYTERQGHGGELAEAAVMERYLPKQLSPEELEAKIREIVAEVGATSIRDMGKVMGVATKRLAGQADGRLISTLVKKLLA